MTVWTINFESFPPNAYDRHTALHRFYSYFL
jgi:hypothetical protein